MNAGQMRKAAAAWESLEAVAERSHCSCCRLEVRQGRMLLPQHREERLQLALRRLTQQLR